MTYKLVNRGSLFSYSDGKFIGCEQLGDGSINVMAWSVRDEDWMQHVAYDLHSGPAVKRAIREQYHDWAPELLNLVQDASDHVTPRSLYMLPVGYRWKHRPGVTLIGDAAHVMTPFAGEGANMALQDAMELAQTIVATSKARGNCEMLWSKVEAFEQNMFLRATRAQSITEGLMRDMLFTRGAPRTVINSWVMRKMRHELHPLLMPLVAVRVYLYFFVFRLLY